MPKHRKTWGIVVGLTTALLVAAVAFLRTRSIPVLQPAGEIGTKERNLMVFAVAISAIIVVPVFTMLALFAWRYREGGHGAYNPKLKGNNMAEAVWWVLPAVIIAIISVVTWRSTYALDPFKPLSGGKTEHIQVVALDWKWLFIYPEQHVASVGIAYIPVNTPVEFDLTSDTVMTSFWAPKLGGQMYAMPGMITKLNLKAAASGQYKGVAANISGKGFADQTFTIAAVQQRLYSRTVGAMQAGHDRLDAASYAALAKPGILKPGEVRYYGSIDPSLYDTTIMKYMMPTGAEAGN